MINIIKAYFKILFLINPHKLNLFLASLLNVFVRLLFALAFFSYSIPADLSLSEDSVNSSNSQSFITQPTDKKDPDKDSNLLRILGLVTLGIVCIGLYLYLSKGGGDTPTSTSSSFEITSPSVMPTSISDLSSNSAIIAEASAATAAAVAAANSVTELENQIKNQDALLITMQEFTVYHDDILKRHHANLKNLDQRVIKLEGEIAALTDCVQEIHKHLE